MERGVLAHGDGIVMLVPLPSDFVVDRQGFESHAFTPYAAFDPHSGRRYQFRRLHGDWETIGADTYHYAERRCPPDKFAARFRASLGAFETPAQQFYKRERLIQLLGRLTGGIENAKGEYVAQRIVGRGAPTTEIWRLSDLHWRVASAEHGLQDLPAYFMNRFQLSRKAAWEFAWVLVRRAYLSLSERLDEHINALVSQAESLNRLDCIGGPKARHRETAIAVFERTLATEIETLKQRVLR